MSTQPVGRAQKGCPNDCRWSGVALTRECHGEKDPEFLQRQAHLLKRAAANAKEFGEIMVEARRASFSGEHGQEFLVRVSKGGRGRPEQAQRLDRAIIDARLERTYASLHHQCTI